MIKQCDDPQTVMDYIGKDYGKCLYMFIDLKKYGLKTDYFKIWIQHDDDENIISLISQYYDGIQIYSKKNDFNPDEAASFINEKKYSMIVGMEETLEKLLPYIENASWEVGYVGKLNDLTFTPDSMAYRAAETEIPEIVKLISEDEALGKPYGSELLLKQYIERYKDSFGRSYILRDEMNHKIICHVATYAETDELAVISGVITSPEYRGKGYSKGTLASLGNELLSEDKDVFSYYYTVPATKMHHGIGFEDIGKWSKILKNRNI